MNLKGEKMDFWTTFLTSNETKYRLARTILQGIIGVLIANLDMLVSYLHIDAGMKAFIVALVMAILSPLMSELGAKIEANNIAEKPQYTFNSDTFEEMMGIEDEEENSMSEQ